MTTPAPTETTSAVAQPAREVFSGLLEQVRDFITEIGTLDPEQAAIRGGLTILVFIGAAIIMWAIRTLFKAALERLAPPPAEGAKPRKRHNVGRWTLRIVRLAVFIGALLVILRVWGVDIAALGEGPVGVVLSHIWRIVLIIIIALAAIEISQVAIRHLFARMADRSASLRRAAQVRTLAPVLIGVATTTLIIVAVMMVLSEVGVEIGPLIAGAGIIGLAIGFGAQTIVKDFLTGIFLIIEDAVSVGDIVGIADVGGVVEEMSIRTIKLRDFDGTLHVIPFSEAQVIHNRTKGFSNAVFNISIAYNADIAKALEIMKQIGDEMRADSEFGPMLVDDIEIFGVDELADSAVMLKARFRTEPSKQWSVQREYLKRLKLAFDREGVEIPFPHLKVVLPDAPNAPG